MRRTAGSSGTRGYADELSAAEVAQKDHTLSHSRARHLAATFMPRCVAMTGRPWEGPGVIPTSCGAWHGAGMRDILLRVIAFFVLTTATTVLMLLAYY